MTEDARMNLVVTGHVDHGKSTIIGRLLADTGSLPEGKLDAVRALCARTSQPFEYAFLLDALKEERAQGITIDAARVFFKSASRNYIILDAPGHIEFLRNMITGAARAEAALLVIDALEGVRENSRRHGYLLSMLGIRQVAVIVNKMDLVDRSKEVFENIVTEYGALLANLKVTPTAFVPVSGMTGENIVTRSPQLPWYHGPTVLEVLDGFLSEPPDLDLPFRMPVQGVYKFTANSDDRRIVAGTIVAGRIAVGDEIVFLPSGKNSHVKSVEGFNRPPRVAAEAREATGFTLVEQIYVTRGELAVRAGDPPPHVSTRFRASVFWVGREALVPAKAYILKLGSARVPVRLEEVHNVFDASTLAPSNDQRIGRHEVADCTLVTTRSLAFDTSARIGGTSRFVLVDRYQIAGGGVITEALPDRQAWVRDKVRRREDKWAHSLIPQERRAERYGQQAGLLLITGPPSTDRKGLGRSLEDQLFRDGRFVYFLGIGNVLYGVDADIERNAATRGEHLRRLSEVSNILLDAGLIVIATAMELTQDDLELVRVSVGNRVWTAWLGDSVTTDISCDVVLSSRDGEAEGVARLKRLLQDNRLVFGQG
jgi:bifunctional enzyme CysN/CysC